jgi:multiple antibiotic resistance protein
MDQDFFKFALAAFVTILVVVDPPGVVPIFVALTQDEESRHRRAILIRAVLIAFGVALFFLIAGRAVLSYLGVTVHAFSISGGILLFVAAMPMLFGQRGDFKRLNQRSKVQSARTFLSFPWPCPCFPVPAPLPRFYC